MWAALRDLDQRGRRDAIVRGVSSSVRHAASCVRAGRLHAAARALELSANQLLDLLQHFDIYRRPERFERFLIASEIAGAAAPSSGAAFHAQAEYLRGAADAARQVTAAPLVEQGYRGAELGEALKRERLAAVARYAACR